MKKFNKTGYLLLFIFLLMGNAMVFFRPIYMDEGFYMYAAKNVADGEILYKDFIFHQTPVSVYIYSLFSGYGYTSYILLRYLSLLLIFLIILLVYERVYKLTKDKGSANAAIFFVIFNGLFLVWNCEVKMNPLGNLFFLAAFFCSTIISFNNSFKDVFLCFLTGMLSGLSVNTRTVYVLPCLILTAFVIYKFYIGRHNIKNLLKYVVFFSVGILVSSGLTLYFLIRYPDDFIFGIFKVNLYAEQIKWTDESNILLWVKFFLQPQSLILIILLLMSIKFKFDNKIYVYFIVLSLILVNSFGYHVNEYLVAIVPFIAYVIGLCYNSFKEKLKIGSVRILKPILIAYLVSIFIGIPYFINLAEGKSLFPNLVEFKEFVDYEKTLPGDKLIASWCNFSVFSNKKGYFKNEYVYSFILDKPSQEEIVKYSLPDTTLLRKQITNKYYDVIILHAGVPFLLYKYIDDIKANYNLRRTFKDIDIYTKN